MASDTKPLSALGLTATRGGDAVVTGVSLDSRDVEPGHLFAALPGTRVHGGEFIQYALRQRAGAILTDRAGAEIAAKELASAEVALVVVEDPKAAFANACALWFGAQPETMVAVTGTNGKTSVASFTRQIWAALGHDAANIGTTGVEGAFSAPGIHTTPDPLTQGILNELAPMDPRTGQGCEQMAGFHIAAVQRHTGHMGVAAARRGQP
jgi:UDP-N-acetylmuramoyl-L-alanyl-D-glutamate--2,6-diaminopimelate ligase